MTRCVRFAATPLESFRSAFYGSLPNSLGAEPLSFLSLQYSPSLSLSLPHSHTRGACFGALSRCASTNANAVPPPRPVPVPLEARPKEETLAKVFAPIASPHGRPTKEVSSRLRKLLGKLNQKRGRKAMANAHRKGGARVNYKRGKTCRDRVSTKRPRARGNCI